MMRWTQATLAAVMAALVATTPNGAMAEPVEIRPAWYEGQSARYELWSMRERRQEMDFAGERQSAEVFMETTGEVTWEVDRVSGDGSAQVVMTYDWLRLEVTTPDGEHVLDSRDGGADNAPLRAVAGASLDVEVAADGSIASVRGVEAIRRRAEHPSAVPREVSFQHLASQLATIARSPAAVEVGDRWSASLTDGHDMGLMHYDLDYRVTDIGEISGIGVATVAAEGRVDLEVDMSDMPDEAPPMDVTMRDASYESQIMVDLSRREVVGRNTIEHSLIEVEVDLGGQQMLQTMDEQHQSQVLRVWEE